MPTVTGTLPELRGFTPEKLYLQVEGVSTYLDDDGYPVGSFVGNVLSVTVVDAMLAVFYIADIRYTASVEGVPTEITIWTGFAIKEGSAWVLVESRPQGSSNSLTGPGVDQVTILIKDDGVPVTNVSVWITTDQAGTNIIAGTLPTDVDGQVKFLLDAGTSYYLWAWKSGKISIQGQLFVAEAD